MDLRRLVVRAIQKIGWIYLGEVFVVTPEDPLVTIRPKVPCEFAAITAENYNRVGDFRDQELVPEFLQKVSCGEIGFFAICDGSAAGSIWATVNESEVPIVVRGFMKLMPKEALIHDIVTGTNYRGSGIGPFMVTHILPALFQCHRAKRVIIDVNLKNAPSLKMMNKAGLQADHRALAVSAFQKLAFHKVLKKYPRSTGSIAP